MRRGRLYRCLALVIIGMLMNPGAHAADAGSIVHFPSAADQGPGQPPTLLDGYLYRPTDEGRHPALVFLHGCGGLLNKQGAPETRVSDWAARLVASGYVVLMVDSFTPRGSGEMCSQSGFKLDLYRARPRDAYGALAYLQAQPFVKADRVGIIGWSQGGGATLFAIREPNPYRPPALPQGDFRAAVAFYPGFCRASAFQAAWTTRVPLLVLEGDKDVWTPAEPCRQLIEAAAAAGAPVSIKLYPGAYHDFDWPGAPIHELPRYVTRDGVVPITGMDEAARADALARVPSFLAQYLID